MDQIAVRKHIIFYGRVQGVGFRYRARHAADYIGVTGCKFQDQDGLGNSTFRVFEAGARV